MRHPSDAVPALDPTGPRSPPDSSPTDMIVDIDTGDNIRARAETRPVALNDPLPQSVDCIRHINCITLILQGLEGTMEDS